jgi:hypothetical protein
MEIKTFKEWLEWCGHRGDNADKVQDKYHRKSGDKRGCVAGNPRYGKSDSVVTGQPWNHRNKSKDEEEQD